MLRMKCSAYWVYYDIPYIYLFSKLHIISYDCREGWTKIDLFQKSWLFPTLATWVKCGCTWHFSASVLWHGISFFIINVISLLLWDTVYNKFDIHKNVWLWILKKNYCMFHWDLCRVEHLYQRSWWPTCYLWLEQTI